MNDLVKLQEQYEYYCELASAAHVNGEPVLYDEYIRKARALMEQLREQYEYSYDDYMDEKGNL